MQFDQITNHDTWNFSHVAIHKARRKIPLSLFQNLATEFIQNLFFGIERCFAVDETKIRLDPSMQNHGFQSCSNATRNPSALVSCIFDVHSKLVQHVQVAESHNERMAFLTQVKENENLFRPNDTFIFDRGYYSHTLARELTSRRFRFVFRLKDNPLPRRQIHRLRNNLVHMIHNENVVVGRVSTYVIHGSRFTLFHSSEISNAHAKRLYGKRWSVEEGFKSLKCNMHLETNHGRNPQFLNQEVWCRVLCHTLISIHQNQHVIIQGRRILRPNQRVLCGWVIHMCIHGNSLVSTDLFSVSTVVTILGRRFPHRWS